MVRFLRAALTGEKVTEDTRRSRSRASGSASCPEQPVPILVAALRAGMLRLAGREGDGAIINWLSADDVRTVAPIVHAGTARTRRSWPASSWRRPTDADTVRGHGHASPSPPTSTCPSTPRSTSGSAAATCCSRCGTLEGRRPQGRARRHPRRAGRRAHRARLARGVPRAHRSATSTTASPRPALAILPVPASTSARPSATSRRADRQAGIQLPWKPKGTRRGRWMRATGSALRSRASTMRSSLASVARS